jgi:hypothetical protein
MPDEVTSLSDIEEDAQNANLGTERGAFALQESLVRFGPGRSILVDRKGRLIAGEKAKRTAERLGLPIEVVKTQGDKGCRAIVEHKWARRARVCEKKQYLTIAPPCTSTAWISRPSSTTANWSN